MNENPSKEGHKKSGIVQGPIEPLALVCCVWRFGLSALVCCVGGIWPFGLRTVTITKSTDALTDPIKITIAADSTQLFDNV